MLNNQNGLVISYNSILGLFILANFGLHLLPDDNAQIAIIGTGRLAVSDDTKNRRVLRILREKVSMYQWKIQYLTIIFRVVERHSLRLLIWKLIVMCSFRTEIYAGNII